MNPAQIVSSAEKLVTVLGTLAVTLGLSTEAQTGPIVAAMISLIGAGGVIIPWILGLLRHTNTAQIVAAAKSIDTLSDTTTSRQTMLAAQPVVNALSKAGVTVN